MCDFHSLQLKIAQNRKINSIIFKIEARTFVFIVSGNLILHRHPVNSLTTIQRAALMVKFSLIIDLICIAASDMNSF